MSNSANCNPLFLDFSTINSNAPKIDKITIIGNASGSWQAADDGYSIIFNGTVSDNKNIINICNGPYAGSEEDFVVTGDHSEWLAIALSVTARLLEVKLHCWPSSGLVSFVLFNQLNCQLALQRMSLLPSLKRSHDMPSNQHLPCVVHNWLGERRIALATINTSTQWPELYLSEQHSSPVNNSLPVNDDPFALLTQVVEQNTQHQVGQEQLNALANTPLSTWSVNATEQKLLTAELVFFNQQPDTETSFWYLSNNTASQYLDPIRTALALCRQQLY
ncbi:hypothetical protein [Shewanella donghaensis]|uniref:hypothetical protein n=1 Tax=Shewanella donghaensis TaxID=238836 RepID=UPI00118350C3|nr:hypothetical protein [Shewanella donghaensis]